MYKLCFLQVCLSCVAVTVQLVENSSLKCVLMEKLYKVKNVLLTEVNEENLESILGIHFQKTMEVMLSCVV